MLIVTSRYGGVLPSEARRRARIDALVHRGTKVVNADTGRTIQLSAAGLKHATVGGARHPADYELARYIPQLVREMRLISTAVDRESRSSVRAVHVFTTRAAVDRVTYVLRIIVRETNDGQFFYDSHAAEEVGPGAVPSTDGRGPS